MSAVAPSAAPIAAGTIAGALAAAAAITAGFKRTRHSADERRVRPRLDRDDHNQTAAAASTSDSDHAAPTDSIRPHPLPASRLYRHALEFVLAFSDAETLLAAVCVANKWLAAAKSMRALALTVEASSTQAECVAASAMARHVADLIIASDDRLTAESMANLALCLPHLRRLRCPYPLLSEDGLLLFPAGLRELELVAFDHSASAGEINAAIEGASGPEQLESLTLRFRANIDSLISFEPLAALPLLRSLTIGAAAESDLTDVQVDELRTLPRLHHGDLRPITTSLLRRLLVQPHDLQWQQMKLPYPLWDETAALLPQLPSLTALRLEAENLTHFDFLHRLPNLVSLHCPRVGLADGDDAQLADRFVIGLRDCTNITDLHLDRCTLTTAHLVDLLPRLPRLRSLTLTGLRIDSLRFLALPPLTSQLRSLTVTGCKKLPVGELRHVHSLRGLRELVIKYSFCQPVEADCAALVALRPPSSALPLLQSFIYSPAD